MIFIFIALAVSLVATVIVMRASNTNAKMRTDVIEGWRAAWVRESNLHGLGRAGGIGVAIGLLVSLLTRLLDDADVARAGLVLLASATPILAAGLIEDFTQKLGIVPRLAAAFVSAALAGWWLGIWVVRLDLPVLDAVLAWPMISILFTCVAVAGVTNAFNIIDGFNGLASGVASLVLLGIAYVAFKVGDITVLAAALTAIGAIAGFMLLNFPRGLVYLGDGGAYLLGFWIAELSILLVTRNPQVSVWFPLLLCSYPVFETLFSIYRRLVVSRAHPGLPDAAHLHHLIYKRLVRWAIGKNLPAQKTQRNALTAPYLWIITSIGVVPAVVFWRVTPVLQICCVLFAAVYIYGYIRIALFRAPRWWVLRQPRSGRAEVPEKK